MNRGRPEKLTEERKKDISDIFRNNPDFKIKRVYEIAIRRWRNPTSKHIRSQYSDINKEQLTREISEELPGYDTVRNYWNSLKGKSSKLDEPWTLLSLVKHPIPPEALPLVTSVFANCVVDGAERWLLSIREALWISRLYKLIEVNLPKHILRLSDEEDELRHVKLEDLVLDWAYVFSVYEFLNDIGEEPACLNEDMTHIMADVFEVYGERWRDAIAEIEEEYGVEIDEAKVKEIKPKLSEIEEGLRISQDKRRHVPLEKWEAFQDAHKDWGLGETVRAFKKIYPEQEYIIISDWGKKAMELVILIAKRR